MALTDEPQGFVMTFAMHSPLAGAGTRPIGTYRLPFLPRQGDVFRLPDGSGGMVKQVSFQLEEQGLGILVVLGPHGGRG